MHNRQYSDSQKEEGTGNEQRWAKGGGNVDTVIVTIIKIKLQEMDYLV